MTPRKSKKPVPAKSRGPAVDVSKNPPQGRFSSNIFQLMEAKRDKLGQARRVTQRQVVEEVGIHPNSFSRLARGQALVLDLAMCAKLIDYFEVDGLSDLFSYERPGNTAGAADE